MHVDEERQRMNNQEQHDDRQTIQLLESLRIVRRNLKRKFQLTVDVGKRNDAAQAFARADELIRLLEQMYNQDYDIH
jgi:hypothetical protein